MTVEIGLNINNRRVIIKLSLALALRRQEKVITFDCSLTDKDIEKAVNGIGSLSRPEEACRTCRDAAGMREGILIRSPDHIPANRLTTTNTSLFTCFMKIKSIQIEMI